MDGLAGRAKWPELTSPPKFEHMWSSIRRYTESDHMSVMLLSKSVSIEFDTLPFPWKISFASSLPAQVDHLLLLSLPRLILPTKRQRQNPLFRKSPAQNWWHKHLEVMYVHSDLRIVGHVVGSPRSFLEYGHSVKSV